jgi:hypothetical protein
MPRRLNAQGKFPLNRTNSLLNLGRELTNKPLRKLVNFSYRLTERLELLRFPCRIPC